MPVVFGVPQDAILGPLLFILYINKINNVENIFGFHIHSYADDKTFYISFNPNIDFDSTSNNIKTAQKKSNYG